MSLRIPLSLFALLLVSWPAEPVSAQMFAPARLPTAVLDVVPPSTWVRGAPGAMTVERPACRAVPETELRRRIVEVAIQEWAFFGFPVLDRRSGSRFLPPGMGGNGFEAQPAPGFPPLPEPSEAARVAPTIAGYWAATPQGAGIVSEQNRAWNSAGVGVRWRSPWSAAFISWVMCEAGAGVPEGFRSAIAHWSYIDQAILARDGRAANARYVAYDLGEAEVEPGDLLCAANRPVYRSLAERRRQLGVGARSHCDVVVDVDAAGGRVLAIGGNVLRAVSLKVLPQDPNPRGRARPEGGMGRPLFAHLKLRAASIPPDALRRSAVLQHSLCPSASSPPRLALVLAELALEPRTRSTC